MRKLRELVGVETDLDVAAAALRDTVQELDPPVVGALEVTCSDESQLEASAAFQRQFVEHLLPDLKPAARAPLRTCNLGARYEWGSVRMAEHHFATPAAAGAFKVLLVKINGHVSVSGSASAPHFGPMRRYETDSAACGALHALLRGEDLPALEELRETLRCAANDRIATLLDPRYAPPPLRYLLAAVCSARLQAARAVNDIRAHRPAGPTLYLVVPCVTLNRPGPDTEIVIGYSVADLRRDPPAFEYHGLGDDPANYRVRLRGDRVRIEEE